MVRPLFEAIYAQGFATLGPPARGLQWQTFQDVCDRLLLQLEPFDQASWMPRGASKPYPCWSCCPI